MRSLSSSAPHAGGTPHLYDSVSSPDVHRTEGVSPYSQPVARSLEDAVFSDPIHGEAARFCLSRAGSLEGAAVADMGCGEGPVSVLMALAGATVVGVDVAADRLRKAAALADACGVGDRCEFVHARAEQSALPSAAFDAVFSKSALQYMDRGRALEEYVRLLAPGGRLLMVENLARSPVVSAFRGLRKLKARSPKQREYVDSIRGYVTLAELDSLASMFTTTERRTYHLLRTLTIGLHMGANGQWLPRALDSAVASIDSRIFRALPGSEQLAWIVAVAYCGRKETSCARSCRSTSTLPTRPARS